MTSAEINKKIEELFKNEDFCVAFFDSIDDIAKIKNLLNENGLILSDDEIAQLIDLSKKTMSSGDSVELSESDMDSVSGGIVGWVVAGAASAVFFGYQVYQGRKGLNRARGVCG